MFARFKNFADSLEESARTAAARNSLSSPPPPAPGLQRSSSTSSKAPREAQQQRDSSKVRSAASIVKERERLNVPDEFDSDFSDISRTGTPAPGEKEADDGNADKDSKAPVEGERDASSEKAQVAAEKKEYSVSDLPSEVRVKLRKLEKMEGKYTGMSNSCWGNLHHLRCDEASTAFILAIALFHCSLSRFRH
jgi:hypothetical protein